MAKFETLEIEEHYRVIDPVSGYDLTCGIQGARAMLVDWPAGAEAYPEDQASEGDFSNLIEVAN